MFRVGRMLGLLIVLFSLLAPSLRAEDEVPTVAAPVFDPSDFYYREPMWVTITCETEGAIIRYTDDDATIPSPAVGIIYKGPIRMVFGNHTLRAIAYKPGWKDSEAVFVTYEAMF